MILLCILWEDLLFAQTNIYHPFPDSNAIWSVLIGGEFSGSTKHYCMKGDTIISSIIYHKLYQTDSLCTTGGIPMGGIRQDTITKKVYILCFNNFFCPGNNEKILYDFNDGIGDTVFYSAFGAYRCKINFIDSVQLLSGQYRKKYGCLGSIYSVIEGIGSDDLLMGLLEFYWGGKLLCFK